MKFPEINLAQQVLQYCKSFGVNHIIISPGSRNAPLTMGFYEDPFFTCYSIVDERCAAFFGMGIAQQLKHPVALLCTSGSAALNYYPALSEAFYSDIPLVAITADRPSDKIDIGDGQTIRQTNVFANHSLYNANLSDKEEDVHHNDEKLYLAFENCIRFNGPVHINVPFEEPLYKMKEGILAELPQLKTKHVFTEIKEDSKMSVFKDDWNASEKKLILVGVQHENEISDKVISFLSNDPSVIVLTETTSNLHHSEFFPAIDQLIAPIEKIDALISPLQPDMLITFGGMVISKKIKAFLRKYPPKTHYHIDKKKAYDTYFCLTHHFKTSVNHFFEVLSTELNFKNSGYKKHWSGIREYRRRKHSSYIDEIPYSDFKVYHILFANFPHNCMLQLSNSSTVRYAQLFDLHHSLKVYCNRGTSGIDGSTSTAIGAANAVDYPTILITGDLSFFYDSNALWNDYIPKNFKIVLINNGGGGIFRILPGPKENPKFHKYFETRHQLKASYLCHMFGIAYWSSESELQLKNNLNEFLDYDQGPALIEIGTPIDVNDEILLNYFKFIQ